MQVSVNRFLKIVDRGKGSPAEEYRGGTAKRENCVFLAVEGKTTRRCRPGSVG